MDSGFQVLWPVSRKSRNVSGPESNIQIEIKRIRARVLASKVLYFVSLPDGFIPCEMQNYWTTIFHAKGDSLPGPRILVFFTWNLNSGFQSLGGSGFLELSSEFQSPLLLIIQTRLHWIQIPQAKITWIPESRFPLYDSRDPTEPEAE